MAIAYVARSERRPPSLFSADDYAQQHAFFADHPELRPTSLRSLPALARALGIAQLRVKDETTRFGLNAFKAAGAMFAVSTLVTRGIVRPGETLVCASEGNHGRAVARAARDAGCAARVYLAASVAATRVAAIESEGATVVKVAGTYDDALRVMAADAERYGWRVISDTALEGEPADVPRLIMLGYTRLMDEAAEQWAPDPPPEVIFVPGGVGGLVAAVADWIGARHGARHGASHRQRQPPRVVCVEPLSAACLQASARAGRPTTVPGPFDTIMAGLRCGEVSRAGFDAVLHGVDGYIAIEDRWALEAIRLLAAGAGADPTIESGASGAAALGGLLAAMRDPAAEQLRAHLALGAATRALIFVTEGVTDPELFARAVARPTSGHSPVENPEP